MVIDIGFMVDAQWFRARLGSSMALVVAAVGSWHRIHNGSTLAGSMHLRSQPMVFEVVVWLRDGFYRDNISLSQSLLVFT